jgi:hypothetical protein
MNRIQLLSRTRPNSSTVFEGTDAEAWLQDANERFLFPGETVKIQSVPGKVIVTRRGEPQEQIW